MRRIKIYNEENPHLENLDRPEELEYNNLILEYNSLNLEIEKSEVSVELW